MTLSEKEIRIQVEEEHKIHVLVTFEMVGKPKKHVQDTLKTFISKLEEDPNVDLINTHHAEAVELEEEEGYFSAFSEIEMLVPQLESLTNISVNLMPASIEILAPDEFRFSARQVMNWENDLLARLHEISQTVRAEKQKVRYLSKNMAALIQNTVTVLLANGPKSIEQLAKLTGIPAERLEQDLNNYKENKLIEQKGDTWQLLSNKK